MAIALDATLVRLVLVPGDDGADGQVELVAARSWLDRILPDMDFEGSAEPVVEHADAEPPLVTT